MDEVQIGNEEKLIVLKQMLGMWKRTHYNEWLNARIAKSIEDERMAEAAKSGMRKALAAIDVIEEEIGGLEIACKE